MPVDARTEQTNSFIADPAWVIGYPSPLPELVLLNALDNPGHALCIFDQQTKVVHATTQFRILLEISCDKPLEQKELGTLLSFSRLNSQATEAAMDKIRAACNGNDRETSVELQIAGRGVCLSLAVRALGDGFFAATFEEIQKTAEAFVPQDRDSLTGIANRDCFEKEVDRILTCDATAQIAVMLIDLDRFKAVNDTLGHAAGDTLLRLVAQRLQLAVRSGDLIARFGGDEFAVLINPALSPEEPARIGKRILDLVQRTYMIEGQLVHVGTSIGIAQSPRDGHDCKTLLKDADLALHQSKKSGRAMLKFFDPSMESRALQKRASELDLRKALALRQFEVYYQPQVGTPAGRLVGFEALIRWQHPVHGLISPADFLPLAEEIGLIVPIGEWVLRTACREALKWPSDITVAVNASPRQFDAGNFEECVRQALQVTGLPGERLEIEITEGILLRDDEGILRSLHALRAMNVRIAMDDFGTGFSSLSQLARFPFDKIKIDRSLVSCQGDQRKQRAIVRAIAALGQSLGVCTLAEGVEDADQLQRLQTDGCESVQGYFFGKPVSSDCLTAVIARLSSDQPKEMR